LVAKELLAYAASGLLLPFGRARAKRTPRVADQRTVVLIHGYLATGAPFLPLEAYLRWAGIEQIRRFEYRSHDGVARAAMALRDFLKTHVRGGRVDLIGHSMGGLVARFYLQELGGSRRVDRCITLATPHQGSYSAYWVPSKVGDSLRLGSPLLQRLEEGRSKAAGVRFSSIVAGSDNFVVPRVFAAQATPPGDDVVHIPNLGHVALLFSPAMYAAVADRLRSPVATTEVPPS
jgi:pimeloyl-ACP methyl ester carboxylesterase